MSESEMSIVSQEMERVSVEDSYSFAAMPPCLKDYKESHHLQYGIEGGGFKSIEDFKELEGGFETIQEFKYLHEALQHMETQEKYDSRFFVHPDRFLIGKDNHVIIFPVLMADFNGCWVKVYTKGGSDAQIQVTYNDMWTILQKIGKNMKYLSSEAQEQRPHGNLIKGTGITSDLQALFLNLGYEYRDPMLYKTDVEDLHELLSSFIKGVTTVPAEVEKLTKEEKYIIKCVDDWKNFLYMSCLQDPVQAADWIIQLGAAIDPPYQNHDHVRLIFNYPTSWSSKEEIRFLANIYKMCSGGKKLHDGLITNVDFIAHLTNCKYAKWNDCFISKRNKSPLNDVYTYGCISTYLDRKGTLMVSTFVVFVYNCIKHYNKTAQRNLTEEEILAKLHEQFPHFVKHIYEAFYIAVAQGYKHPHFSIEQILTERI